MKFFHISDLHIGLKLLGRDLYEDQAFIFTQIAEAAEREQPDAIVVAGDIYDKAVPSAEAVELFDHFIHALTEAAPKAVIMMISGNHDSGPRINCFRGLLSRQNVHMIGLPPQREDEYIEKVTVTDESGPVNFYLLPFVKPSMVKDIVGTDKNGNNLSYNETLHRLLNREPIQRSERNVLVSHQFYLPEGTSAETVDRMDSEVRMVGNIDEVSARVLEPFDYAALGHIHKPMKVGSDFYRYCGTPLACSVSEAGQQKGIIVVEMGEKKSPDAPAAEFTSTRVIPLHPKRAVRVLRGTLEEVLEQKSNDYVSVTLTDRVDLDVIDMQDRLRSAFPFLLEIRRETQRRADYNIATEELENLNPFEICCRFLGGPDEEQRNILKDVINTVEEKKV